MQLRSIPSSRDLGRHVQRALAIALPEIICIACSIPIALWFAGGHPIGWSDSGLLAFLYHPKLLLETAITPWNGYTQLGNPSAQYLTLAPLARMFQWGRDLHVSYAVLQAAWYFIIEYLTLRFAYAFLKRILQTNTATLVPSAIAGALIYAYSPVMIENYWLFSNDSIVLPALLAGGSYLAVAVAEDARWWARPAQLALLIVVCAPPLSNPGYAAPVAVGIAAWFLVATLRAGRIIRNLFRAVTMFTTAAVASAWFAVPLAIEGKQLYASASLTENSANVLGLASANTSAWSLIRFVPLAANAPAWAPYWEPAWRKFYESIAGTAIGVSFLILAIAGAVLGCGKLKYTCLGVGFAISGILLSLGTNGPTGSLYMFAFQHVPGFSIFRDPVNKFVLWLALGEAVLVSSALRMWSVDRSVERLFDRWRRHGGGSSTKADIYRVTLFLAVLGTTAYYGWPMVTGAVAQNSVKRGTLHLSSAIAVPRTVKQIARAVRRQQLTRVLVLPLSGTGYRWEPWRFGYSGPDLSWLLFGVPTISGTVGQAGPSASLLAGMSGLSPREEIALAAKLGVDGIIVEKNFVPVGAASQQGNHNLVAQYLGILRHTNGVRQLAANRQYALYGLVNTTKAVQIEGGKIRSVVVRGPSRSVFAARTITINGRMSKSSLVVVRTAFSGLWAAKATVLRSSGCVQEVLPMRHEVVDGYANGWSIGKLTHSCAVRVEIYNRASQWASWSRTGTSAGIGILVLVGAAAYLGVGRRRNVATAPGGGRLPEGGDR